MSPWFPLLMGLFAANVSCIVWEVSNNLPIMIPFNATAGTVCLVAVVRSFGEDW